VAADPRGAPITEPTPIVDAPPVVVAPVQAADAGVALYADRAGPPINTGLTEGSSNFATITAEARRSILPPE
jgi:hypothetical protein